MSEETPLHHYPGTTGDQGTAHTATDCWERFFGLRWDWYEELMRRRAAQQEAAGRGEEGCDPVVATGAVELYHAGQEARGEEVTVLVVSGGDPT